MIVQPVCSLLSADMSKVVADFGKTLLHHWRKQVPDEQPRSSTKDNVEEHEYDDMPELRRRQLRKISMAHRYM